MLSKGVSQPQRLVCHFKHIAHATVQESHENDPGQKMTLVVKTENDPGFKMDRKMVQVLKGKITLVSILLGKWSRY